MAAATVALTVWPGRDKKTQRRVWAVESRSRTKANGFPTFHLIAFDWRKGQYVCPCEARKECVHCRAASEASKAEKAAEFERDEARRAQSMTQRREHERAAAMLEERMTEAAW